MRLPYKVVEFLKKNPDERFTAREIANWVLETYPSDCHAKIERSRAMVQPVNDKDGLLQQLVAEIGSNQKQIFRIEPKIRTTEGRPRRYYFSTETTDEPASVLKIQTGFSTFAEEIADQNTNAMAHDKRQIKEHDLYPILS